MLFLQEDVADRSSPCSPAPWTSCAVGDPALLSTDVGPVIDDEAQATLDGAHGAHGARARLIRRRDLGPRTEHGSFVAPTAVRDRLARRACSSEVFGPVLHVVR